MHLQGNVYSHAVPQQLQLSAVLASNATGNQHHRYICEWNDGICVASDSVYQNLTEAGEWSSCWSCVWNLGLGLLAVILCTLLFLPETVRVQFQSVKYVTDPWQSSNYCAWQCAAAFDAARSVALSLNPQVRHRSTAWIGIVYTYTVLVRLDSNLAMKYVIWLAARCHLQDSHFYSTGP